MKDAALTILKVAFAIFPPLADLIGDLIDRLDANDPRQALADEVRSVLPERSETRKALDELEGKKDA